MQRPDRDDPRPATLPAATTSATSTDAPPEQIEPGLWRIPLPLPFALRSANVYLIAEPSGARILVDAGLGLPDDEAALRAGLAEAGVRLDDITALVLTHAHPDHIGLAGPIHAASGAPVYILRGEDERMYTVWAAPEDGDGARDALSAVGAMYAANGMAPDEAAGAERGTARLRRILRLPPRASLTLLEDGQPVRLGAHAYTPLWTPGHSDYHMCLLRDDGLFIAGDHILPGITPNIGLYPGGRPDPLGDYYDSLARVRDLPARLVLPGHRRPFADLAARADELRDHHRERAERVLALLSGHPTGRTAAQVAEELFEGRLRTGDDRRFALAETLAHLEHLRRQERVARTTHDGLFLYRALSDTAVGTPALSSASRPAE